MNLDVLMRNGLNANACGGLLGKMEPMEIWNRTEWKMTQVGANLFRENELRENNSVIRLRLPYPKHYNNLTGGSLDNLNKDLLIGESTGSIQ